MGDMAIDDLSGSRQVAKADRWRDLVILTWNRGNGTKADLKRIIKTRRPDVIGFQEMSDAPPAFLRILRRRGYRIIVSKKAGGAATPLALRKRRFVTKRRRFRPGARKGDGPYIRKNKYVTDVTVHDKRARRRVNFRLLHAPYKQSIQAQRKAADDMMETGFSTPHDGVPTFLMGDFNRKPASVLAPADWECSQQQGEQLATHGKGWSPDQIWWHRSRDVEFVDHDVLRGTKSDHRPYSALYRIKETR